MNERIKKLASQCWDRRLDGIHFDVDMFAELIVRECIAIVEPSSYRQALSNEFNPDWNQVEALQESLREHMAEIQRLRQALAQPEQEPVAWMYSLNDKVGEVARTVVMDRFNLSVTSPYGREGIDYAEGMIVKEFPVYTAPPKREWVGLTDDDFNVKQVGKFDVVKFARYIEAKLKEKNT